MRSLFLAHELSINFELKKYRFRFNILIDFLFGNKMRITLVNPHIHNPPT